MDTDGKRITRGHARSRCDTGIFPAYGLLYVSPMACICSDYLNGYFAIVGEKEWDPVPNEQRLVKGPAEVPSNAPPAESDWAMFRGNPKRSSATSAQGPLSPKLAWKTKVADWPVGHLVEDWKALETTAGVISAPTSAAGKVFVAVPDQHQVRAFDAKTGQPAWAFTTGARVNSPPTIHDGLCLFCGQDGWCYCLTADKGEPVWKFLAARSEKKIAVQSQLESVWPVPGSVMIHKGQVVVVAGRQSGMDQGMVLYHLDVRTGNAQGSARIWNDPDAPTAGPKGNAGYQPIDRRVNDLLVRDGVKPHLLTVPLEDGYSTDELVDTANFFQARGHHNRNTGNKTPPQLLWASSNGFITGHNESVGRFDEGLMCYANKLRAARIAFDDRLIIQWGIRGKDKGPGYEMKQGAVNLETAVTLDADLWKSLEGTTFQTRAVGSARSLVLSANAIYYGGSKQIVIVDRATHKESARLNLPAPLIRDGLAVAGGRLIAACEDGSIACFE